MSDAWYRALYDDALTLDEGFAEQRWFAPWTFAPETPEQTAARHARVKAYFADLDRRLGILA